MKLDTDMKHLAITVTLAILIPFAIRSGITNFVMENNQEEGVCNQRALYIAGAIGVVCMFVGSQIPVQAVGLGFFIGGLVTLIKVVKHSWPDLDPMSRFWFLIAGILVAMFFGMRGNFSVKGMIGKIGSRKKRKNSAA